MKLPAPVSVQWLSEFTNAEIIGNDQNFITGINEIHQVENGDIVFVDHPKYYQKALNCAATTVLIDQEVECPEGKALIVSKFPFDDYNKLTRHFSPNVTQSKAISDSSEIHKDAIIYPNVFIGHNVKIGYYAQNQAENMLYKPHAPRFVFL